MSEKQSLSSVIGEEEMESMARVGIALRLVQTVEVVLRLVMTFVLQKDEGPLSIQKLEAQTKAERKKTLGYFLIELRKRAGLRDDLEAMLDRFLEARNTLAHRLDDIPGWEQRDTVEGRLQAYHFLSQLSKDSFTLVRIFTALTAEWQKEAMPDAQLPNAKEVEELTKDYRPIVDDLFFAKE